MRSLSGRVVEYHVGITRHGNRCRFHIDEPTSTSARLQDEERSFLSRTEQFLNFKRTSFSVIQNWWNLLVDELGRAGLPWTKKLFPQSLKLCIIGENIFFIKIGSLV